MTANTLQWMVHIEDYSDFTVSGPWGLIKFSSHMVSLTRRFFYSTRKEVA